MISLIMNENVKIYRRVRTWIFGLIVLLAVVAIALVTEHGQVMHRGSETGWSFVNDLSPLISLITIFIAVVAGDSVASEFSSGAVKLLLIRPVSRTKILWSKYLSVLSFGFVFVIALWIFGWIIGGLFFGFGGALQPYSYNDASLAQVDVPMSVEVLRSYALDLIPLVMTVTVSFMISTVFRSSSLAIAISILLMLFGESIVLLLRQFSWDKYILFANENFMQYIQGKPFQDGMSIPFSIVVLLVYFLIFHIVSWFAFTRRDVAS